MPLPCCKCCSVLPQQLLYMWFRAAKRFQGSCLGRGMVHPQMFLSSSCLIASQPSGSQDIWKELWDAQEGGRRAQSSAFSEDLSLRIRSQTILSAKELLLLSMGNTLIHEAAIDQKRHKNELRGCEQAMEARKFSPKSEKHRRLGTPLISRSLRARLIIVCICARKKRTLFGRTAPSCCRISSSAILNCRQSICCYRTCKSLAVALRQSREQPRRSQLAGAVLFGFAQ